MTNPGGMASRHDRRVDVAPLFPRHHLQPDDDPGRQRDLQVWPRTMREDGGQQSLFRTAGVKHSLRAMAGRNDMLTTYEHDFAKMQRPQPNGRSTSFGATLYGTGGKTGTSYRDTMNLAKTESMGRMSAKPRAFDGDDSDVVSIRSTNLGSRERDLAGSLGHSTMSKMHAAKSQDKQFRMTLNGWGDQRWNHKSHPHMVLGMSAHQIGLVQTSNIMNLRAPDIPFSTR